MDSLRPRSPVSSGITLQFLTPIRRKPFCQSLSFSLLLEFQGGTLQKLWHMDRSFCLRAWRNGLHPLMISLGVCFLKISQKNVVSV
ncbi:hypothetical protein ACFX13_029017 [Malus domestica]